jgi:hypothetical protein
LLQGEHARLLVERAYTDIQQGELVDTYARSAFEDTRRKAAKYGAMGSSIRATKRPHGHGDRASARIRQNLAPPVARYEGGGDASHA